MLRVRLQSLLWNVVAWILALGLYLLVRFYGTQDVMDWATGPRALIVLWIVVGTLFGILYWLITLAADSAAVRRRSYGYIIAFKTAGLLLTACLVVLVSRIAAFAQGSISVGEILPSFLHRLSHRAVTAFLVYVTVMSALYSLIRQLRIMVGGRVLFNLILGKYHFPKEEQRIFMFLDLKSSTTHAERLGHIRFCKLIQDCFSDLTDSALRHAVEIYQYVGDEAILTWTIEDGVRDGRCVRVLFDFEQALRKRADHYRSEYGLVPEFKAGVNVGPVTAAEVGVLKRDIAYLSDVLNTAARIQGKCNEYGKTLLVSDAVKRLLEREPSSLRFEHLGELALKGKENLIDVYSVTAQ